MVLIIVCLPGSELVSLDEPALSLTIWQIKPSSSFKDFGSRKSCTAFTVLAYYSTCLFWFDYLEEEEEEEEEEEAIPLLIHSTHHNKYSYVFNW